MPTISRARRRSSQAMAHAARARGTGAAKTQPKQTSNASILSRLGSAAIGFVSGGPVGAITGAVTDPLGRATGGGTPSRPAPPGAGRGFAGGGMIPFSCPEGTFRLGDRCVQPSAGLPGGDPLVFDRPQVVTSGGGAVIGSFGLPAKEPEVESRIHRSCGPGMVLGKDNLCYPKAVLSRRSRFRKWRAAPRPPVTSSDVKAIRRAARAKDRVKDLAKDVGFSVKKR